MNLMLDRDKVVNFVEDILLFFTIFYSFALSLFERINIPIVIYYIIWLLVFFLCLIINRKKIKGLYFILYIFWVIIVLLNTIFFNIEEMWNILIYYLIICVSFFWTGILVDFNKHIKFIYYISIIYIALLFVYVSNVYTNLNTVESKNINYMGFAYYAVVPILFCMYYYTKRKNIFRFLIVLMGLLYLIMCGTRGPILCVLGFFVCSFILDFKNISKRNLIFFVLLLIALTIIICNIKNITEFLHPIFVKNHLSTRILDYFIVDNSTINTSGRGNLYYKIVENINKHPILGSGLYSDRKIIGVYSHDIFLEVFNSFGIPIGSVIIIYLTTLIITSYRLANDKERYLISIFFCASIIRLFFSYSFMEDINFYILIGLCTKYVYEREEISSHKVLFYREYGND